MYRRAKCARRHVAKPPGRNPPTGKTLHHTGVTPITFSSEAPCEFAAVEQQGYVMAYFRKLFIATRILALLALPLATPAAAATFDGNWNVQIASSSSTCTSAGSVSLGINNGQVASNSAMVAASGRVAEAGTISVTLISGIKRAVGFGRLSGTSGSGTWHAALCSGTWVAQRI
jgi:hypothetical protein